MGNLKNTTQKNLKNHQSNLELIIRKNKNRERERVCVCVCTNGFCVEKIWNEWNK